MALSKAIPEWRKVKDGYLCALDFRQEKISSHAVVLRALGGIGAELMKEDPHGWKTRILDLATVDWSKKNKDWENICIIANSVVSNRQARQATKAYLKRHLGLPLNESEVRSLAKPSASDYGDKKSTVEPLSDEQRDALVRTLLQVVRKFDAKAKLEEGKLAFDAWMALPDQPDLYAGLWFEKKESALYWYIPKSYVPVARLSNYESKGRLSS